MKKHTDNIAKFNKKIQDEIHRRVFEESHKRKQENAEATDKQIEIDALSEVSGLPPGDVKRISEEVKAEFVGSAESTVKPGRFRASYLIALLVIAGIAGIITFSVADNFSKQARKQAEEKKIALYSGLLKAIEDGNIEMTTYFLDQGAPMQVSSPYYESTGTALMAAAYYDNVPIVRLLLKRGADVTIQRTSDHWTALDVADHRENQALVKILGQAMADASPEQSPVRKLWEKSIPFTCYAFAGQVKLNNLETARLFLEAGININATGRSGTYDDILVLQIACRNKNIEMVRLILGFSGPDKKPQLDRPLRDALVYKNKKDLISLLLEAGANPDSVNFDDTLYDLEVAELLLKYGANINAGIGDNQQPALIIVLSTWDTRVDDTTRKKWVRFLLDHGANVNDRGGGIVTALQMAKQWGNKEVIDWIMKAGASEVDSD